MKNNDQINNITIILSKEQLLYLESRVKNLIDNGNYELAYIMSKNISKYLDNNYKDIQDKKILKMKKA